MAYLNGMLSAITEPTGFWINIIKFFENGVGQYVVAIILLTLIIKVIWSFVDLVQKWSTQKQSLAQAKMQPEMEALKKKYEKQPQVLQQKQNELQKKYLGKSMTGSCIIMLVVMVLNLLIFFSLFSSLNTMASYKSAVSYDSIKYTYINCVNVVDDYLVDGGDQAIFEDYENITFVITQESEPGENDEEVVKKYITMNYNGSPISDKIEYSTDFSGGTREVKDEEGNPVIDEETGLVKTEKIPSNTNVVALLNKYFPVDEEGNYDESQDIILVEGEDNLYLSEAIQNAVMVKVVEVYDQTKDSFLWIENIWVADSPLNKSIVSYSTLVSQIGASNVEENEETIYNAFMPDLKEARDRVNGYFILPLLCILASFGTSELTTWYNKRKNKKKGLPPPQTAGKFARIFMPMLLGVFALLYNSVFAMYMLTGQIVSLVLLVPQLMIVDKLIEHSEKKKKAKEKESVVTVDYSRKF
ncbi:MAG: YidC/Oxa1 family membrane protein insertase [Clostridia bacterium]|nr:YidC/Oxa1 family membrane protein insertase [Clostridia bacterium]